VTATQDRIRARMIALVQEGTWSVVPSAYAAVIRLTKTVTTPEANLGDGFGRWPEPTYDRHLFVTLTSQGVIVGDAVAPWIGRHDSTAPYWLVEEMLAASDPWAVWDRRLERKHERRGGVRGDGVRGYR
jgi:hypothetical protein